MRCHISDLSPGCSWTPKEKEATEDLLHSRYSAIVTTCYSPLLFSGPLMSSHHSPSPSSKTPLSDNVYDLPPTFHYVTNPHPERDKPDFSTKKPVTRKGGVLTLDTFHPRFGASMPRFESHCQWQAPPPFALSHCHLHPLPSLGFQAM